MPIATGQARTATSGRELWRQRVEATPDAPFLVDANATRSFGDTDVSVRRVAAGLEALGIERGRRVAVAMPNAVETFWVHAALRELGAVMVPLVPGLTFAELAFQLTHSEATALVTGGASAEELLPRLGELGAITTTVFAGGTDAVDASTGQASLEDFVTLEPRLPESDSPDSHREPWAIFYTSGSTGRPKGVVLPAGAFVDGGWGYAQHFGLSAEDAYVVATPMAHAVGGLTQPSGAIHMGSRLAILDHFSPSRFWQEIEQTNGTVAILFPAHLNLLLSLEAQGPPAGQTPLRLAITHQYIGAFRERFGVELGVCWGMTETGAGSTGSLPGYRGELGDGYVGAGMEGVEVGILDPDGEPVPAGEIGEICLATRHQMLGYLKDDAATAATLAGGWVHSGDHGFLDPDGGLFFRGRIKNMIKRSGENISPQEIETAIDRHPAVGESLVLSVPDPVRTEEVAAVVVRRAGEALEAAELYGFLGEQLAAWKLPRYIELRDTPLPRLPNGKLDAGTVRAEFAPDRGWDRLSPQEVTARLLGGTVLGWGQLVAGNSRTTWGAQIRRGADILNVVARADGGDGPFSGTPFTLEREAGMYRALQGQNIPLPAFYGFDRAANLVVLERVPGEPAWNAEVLAALLRELARLHAIDTDKLELAGVARSARGEFDLWAEIAASRLSPASAYVDFAIAFLRDRFPGEPPKLAVVHGDPGLGNLLWQDGQITALLDWEMSHLGDPLDDLAFLTVRAAMFGTELPDFSAAVRAHYGVLGTEEQARLRYWQAVSVLRNLIICLSVISNPVRGRERLVHWMLVPSLQRLLMRSLGELAGVEVPAALPVPEATALAGTEVLAGITAELDGLSDSASDPEARQRLRRARHLLAQLSTTISVAPQIGAAPRFDGDPDGDERANLLELAAAADRFLWLFPKGRALGEARLPGVTA
jgi:crotonobetaine/carnitine-CoA ligase